MSMFGQMGEMKKLYDKYKTLQDKLKNLVIRAKEWKFVDTDGTEREDAILVDMSGEMKVSNLAINDTSLLSPDKKELLESLIIRCIQKAQNKAQEVVAEKTKEILGFDPSDMAGMMAGGKIPGMS
jgi:DNA-binding protein YbaB